MMQGFQIKSWAAWAPGLICTEDWQKWAMLNAPLPADDSAPDVKFIPAMTRRRLSRLTKIALRVAHDAVIEAQPMTSVFASRHGELHRTTQLLNQFATEKSMSPTGFSMSVHNTSSGLYSIINKDPSQTTAIAAGEQSFFAGLLESVIRLTPDNDVLFVYVDESIPSIYHPYCSAGITLGFAAHLSSREEAGFSLDSRSGSGWRSSEHDPLAFIRFLVDRSQPEVMVGDNGYCVGRR
jgi:hypothetical protein